MFLPSQFLLALSLITLGAALMCYECTPGKNAPVTSVSGPSRSPSSCSPEPVECDSANATYCMSMRRRTSLHGTHMAFKTCANKDDCVAAHVACQYLINLSRPHGECDALCCEGNLCNLHHGNVVNILPSTHMFFFVIITLVIGFV